MTSFLGIAFDDDLSQEQVVNAIITAPKQCIVMTPNVDHVISFHENPDYRLALGMANLILCDSKILKLLSFTSSAHLKHVIPGSNLVLRLMQHNTLLENWAVVGGESEDVSRLNSEYIKQLSQINAPYGLKDSPVKRQKLVKMIIAQHPPGVFLCVGSPQQEYLAKELFEAGYTGHILCVGASFDFLTGKQKRAPRLFQLLALEWLFRFLTSPTRLFKRYFIRGPKILRILIDQRRITGS